MKRMLMMIVAGLVGAAAVAKGPMKVIMETDMGNDIDDALALAACLRACDQGQMELLAVGCHKNCATAARFVDVVTTWYRHPEVQIGMSLTPVQEFSNYVDYTVRPATKMDFPVSKTEYPDPVRMYRKILAESPNHSVVFISLGFGTTIAQLLESEPDDISPLSGVKLVAKKASYLSVMAGSYGEKKRSEYNVRNDIPAMQKVFELWPNVIYQNPFEIGPRVMYPAKLVEQNLGYEAVNPVAEAYKDYHKMPYDRPSWDILSVLWCLRPEIFTVSVPGKVTVDNDGYTAFEPKKSGKHYVLSATLDQPQALKEYMCEMTTAASSL